MKIARIHIENYRSIRTLDLYPDSYCVLIGENNAGKSNILKAVNLVLGEMWPTDRTFTLDDFYRQDSEHDIIIQVYFDQPLDTWKNMSLKVHGFELRGKAYKRSHRGMPKGTLAVDYTCINAKGETIRYPAEPLQEGRQAKLWYDLKVSREMKDSIPFIYIDILRDYHRHDPTNRWSVLRKLLNQVNTEIGNDKSTIKVLTPHGEEKMTRKQAFEYRLREAYSYLQTPDLTEIEAKIRQNTLDQMGLGQEDIALHFAAYDPVNVCKNLQIFVEQMGISSSAEMVGAGMQSAIVIAIFRTYEEMKKDGAVFAIEGPEVFLHPQKERYFHEVLHAISGDNQVLIATHSPEFVKISCPHEVCLIRRSEAEGTKAITCTPGQIGESVKQELELLNYFDTQRNELYFARGLILAAGATEKHFIPYIAHRLGLDLNRNGVAVIDCGEKGNLPLYKEVADCFSIPCVAVLYDGILPQTGVTDPVRLAEIQEINSCRQSENEVLAGKLGIECLFWISIDRQSEAGFPRGMNEFKKVLQYYDSQGIENVPNSLIMAIQTITQATQRAQPLQELAGDV